TANRANGRVCPDHAEIAEASMELGGAALRVSGEVRDYADPAATLELQASGPLTALAPLLPEGVSPRGNFALQGGGEWRPLAAEGSYQADLTASDVRFSAFEQDAPPGRLSAHVQGDHNRVSLE